MKGVRSYFVLAQLLRWQWSRFAIGSIFMLGLSSPSFGAQVTTSIANAVPTIDVVGEIDQQTPRQIASAVKELRRLSKDRIFLRLNSGGGDLEAAIAAGILAREEEMFTIVPERGACASACALAFLGGVIRLVAGRYGIHRPYAIRYTDSAADAKRSYETVNKLAANYLAQMNINPRVLEAMNLISPGDIHWLAKAERQALGIEATDPVFEDRTSSAYAKRLGITKRELYERKQRATSLCFSSHASSDEIGRCYLDIVERGRK